MRHFCILTNESKDADMVITNRIRDFIVSNGGDCVLLKNPFEDSDFSSLEEDIQLYDTTMIPESCESLLVLGGDGTIISAARRLGNREIPIVGINLGTLGFLSVVEKHNIEKALTLLFEDKYNVENRMLLSVTTHSGGEVKTFNALNDVTVTRNGLSRMITTDVYINEELIGSYSGDGCMVTTPTGSTGYNLSAGGPVITPENELMCITPICPHTLYNRSIIVSAKEKIKIVIGERRKSREEEAFATIDGQIAISLNTGGFVTVEKATAVTKLIRFEGRSYFKVLHSKLEKYPASEW